VFFQGYYLVYCALRERKVIRGKKEVDEQVNVITWITITRRNGRKV